MARRGSSSRLHEIIEQLQLLAVERHHGCTIVLDLGEKLISLSGQTLVDSLDLTEERHLRIASSMSSVDGAIHIDRDCKLLAFACLLDGKKLEKENLDRGARYNSALRFTHGKKDVIVVVVSEDGYRTVFDQNGEVEMDRQLKPLKYVERSRQLLVE